MSRSRPAAPLITARGRASRPSPTLSTIFTASVTARTSLQSIESALDTPHKMCKITHAMSSPEPTPHAPITPATHIKDLVEDPDNRRAHTPRNIGMIADSLQAVGVGRSIVIDEKNQLI